MAKIKVSQATIDKIKKMGMTKALGSASSNKSAEFQEGLRRMYGEKRLSKALGSTSKSKAVPRSAVKQDKVAVAFKKDIGVRMSPRNSVPSKPDYRSGMSLLKKQQTQQQQRIKAMSSSERKAYYGTQAKQVGKTALFVASALPMGRAAMGAASAPKLIKGAMAAASRVPKTRAGVAAATAAKYKNTPPLKSTKSLANSGKMKKIGREVLGERGRKI